MKAVINMCALNHYSGVIPSTNRASYLPVPSVHIETTEQTSKPCVMGFVY
jgi:hypothetical protein